MRAQFWIPFTIFTFAVSVAFTKDLVLDTIVVDAPNSNSSGTVLTKEDLRHRRTETVAQVLRQIPGVDVAMSGGPGQPASVFIRGAKAEHTLVLIDGIEAADATTTTRFFDFSSLTIENIDRIEVYRGVQSTRFGADAIGGVINIISKRGSDPSQSSLAADVGSYRTARLAGTFAGRVGGFNYSFGASRFTTRSFSAAEAGDGDEPDGLNRTTLSSRLGYDFSSATNIDFTIRAFDAAAAQDFSGGLSGDDPNYNSSSRQILTGATLRSRLSDKEVSSFGLYFGSSNRKYDNDPDMIQVQNYHENFSSENLKIESTYRRALEHFDEAKLDLGVQYRQEAGTSDQTLNGVPSRLDRNQHSILGESLIYSTRASSLSFEAGVRHDQVSSSGDSVINGQTSIAYQFENTLVSAGYGTGFKNPSLFQLYSNFGSRNLKCERAATLDLSAEQRLSGQSQLKFGYFENRFTDLIDFDIAASRYSNIARAYTSGFEIQLITLPSEEWTVTIGGKSLTARDEQTGLRLLRRPERSFSAEAKWSGLKFFAAIGWRFVGPREDIDPATFARVALDSYHVTEANFAYSPSEKHEMNVRFENLFDAVYQDVAGYRTSRSAVYAGYEAKF